MASNQYYERIYERRDKRQKVAAAARVNFFFAKLEDLQVFRIEHLQQNLPHKSLTVMGALPR